MQQRNRHFLWKKYSSIPNMEKSIHCFPLLNVIKSHENLMPRIGHDFAVVDFELANFQITLRPWDIMPLINIPYCGFMRRGLAYPACSN